MSKKILLPLFSSAAVGLTLLLSGATACGGASANSTDGASASSTSAPKDEGGDSSDWPTGKMKVDKIEDDGGELDLAFTDSASKAHAVKIVYNFNPAALTTVTFDGKTLDKVPEWRALAKYFQDREFPLRNSRPIQILACVHSQEDHVDQTTAWCAGWTE